MTTTITLSSDDYQALLSEQQRLANQLRLVTVERDLFLNEAEALVPQGTPMAEDVLPEVLEVAAHSRKKRGRKPLDPHRPREIVRHE